MNELLYPVRRPISAWFWNPFSFVAGGMALAAGLAFLLITGAIAAPNRVHFDGVIDTHIGFDAPVWVFLAEGIVNWICLSTALLTGGIILKGKNRFRAVDLFGTQALARWPFFITAAICYLPGIRKVTDELNRLARAGKLGQLPEVESFYLSLFSVATLAMILVTVWFVVLAWKSFRISCDLRGGKAVATFVISLVVAELISKYLIMRVLASLIP